MRLRSTTTTTTTTGATTWRVGPSGMAPLPWWRRVLSRRDRRSVRRVRQPGSRRRRGREPAPGRRALAGPALCAATGICSRIAYERVWPPGCWGFSPGRLYLFSPLPLPSPWSVLFPRRFREARWDRRPRAGVLLCRPARRRAAAQGTASHGSLQRRRPRRTEAIQPPPPHRRKVSHGSVQDARYPGPGRSLFLNRPVAGRRCRTGALGAVAGTADANACVRGAGGGVCLLPSGCLSLFSAARLPLPWFVRIPRRCREARQTGGHGRC